MAERVVYRTEVVHLPATPLGLLPPRWAISHYCGHCHQRVEPDQLITHAQNHIANDHPDHQQPGPID
jgi:hypothetical protein